MSESIKTLTTDFKKNGLFLPESVNQAWAVGVLKFICGNCGASGS